MADAYGSGPYGGNPVKVQVLSPAPYECKPGICRVFCFQHSIAHSRNFAQTLLRRTSPQNLDIAAQTLARTSCIHHVKHGKCNLSPSPRKDGQQSTCRHDSMNKRTNPFPLRNLREEGRSMHAEIKKTTESSTNQADASIKQKNIVRLGLFARIEARTRSRRSSWCNNSVQSTPSERRRIPA